MEPDRLWFIESINEEDDPLEWSIDFNMPGELEAEVYENSLEDGVFGILLNEKTDADRLVVALADEFPHMTFRVRSCLVLALPTKDLKIATYGVAADKGDGDE